MSIFAVYCDGGLCNRLNALVAARILAKQIDRPLHVYWPINTWCNLDYYSIFETESFIEASKHHMLELNTHAPNEFELFAHEVQLFSFNLKINPNLIKNIESLLQIIISTLDFRSVLYFNSMLPYCIPLQAASMEANLLPFKTEYFERANDFLTSAFGSSLAPWSIHLRGTDFGFPKFYYDFWYSVIKVCPINFLLLTDDIVIKNKFASLTNINVRNFNDYPVKLDHLLGWQDKIVDDYGRSFNFNIQRSAASVKESIVDLLILSKSNLFINSNSTFLVFAMLIRGYKFSIISFCYFKYRKIRQFIRILRKG